MERRRVEIWIERFDLKMKSIILTLFLRFLNSGHPPFVARGNFLTIHKRPVQPISPSGTVAVSRGDEGVGIVVQGPVISTRDFTLNTVRQYRQLFPRARIVLSTVGGIPKALEDSLLDLDCKVTSVASHGVNPGFSNSNLQSLTSAAGLETLRETGCEFALKVRSDQRLYNEWTFLYLRNLMQKFPADKAPGQSNRLVFVSLNSFASRIYGLSDMFLFGSIEDVSLYWSGSLDDRPYSGPPPRPPFSRGNPDICEAFFLSQFLEKIGDIPDWSVQHYESVLRERALIIDADTIDIYWPKYSPREHRWRNYEPSSIHTELTHDVWLMLAEGQMTLSELIV